jgi:hypothetical protein
VSSPRRRTANALEIVRIAAPDLPAAHAALGETLRPAIGAVVERRLAQATADELASQLRTVRGSRAHLERRAAEPGLSARLCQALNSYLSSLDAWADAAGLELLRPLTDRSGCRWTSRELAFWLQDDNTGCQTGLARARDGSVLLWHTEEDTIGFFDRPRLLELTLGESQLGAFLYPYLLPGPAFGWHRHGLIAFDTLSVRRTAQGGTPTSAFSWMLWSMQGELPPMESARALCPFLDGGAFTVVERGAGLPDAQVIEVAGDRVAVERLSEATGARRLQVNMACARHPELCALELLDDAARAPYLERLERAARLLDACDGELDEAALQHVLASREGGEWAFANDDVVAHLVARVGCAQMALNVGVGPARAGSEYAASRLVR